MSSDRHKPGYASRYYYRVRKPRRQAAGLPLSPYKHGFTPALFLQRREEQQDRCAICDTIVAVFDRDHDHATGLARGLLCRSCNLLVGYLEHPHREKAEAYLAAWRAAVCVS